MGPLLNIFRSAQTPAAAPPPPRAERIPRRSSGFQEFSKFLDSGEGLTVLDLGPTSARNLTLFTSKGHKIYSEDVLAAAFDPALQCRAEDGSTTVDVPRFLAENLIFNGARFDDMLRKNPEVAVRIIRKYSKRLREANTLLERLVGREVDADQAALESTHLTPPERGRIRLVDVASGASFFFSRGDETTIGRADPVTGILPDIDLTPVDNNRSVSRRHAKIIRAQNEYHVLEEVGTVNGTYVNDQPISAPRTLNPGDKVRIGHTVVLVVSA